MSLEAEFFFHLLCINGRLAFLNQTNRNLAPKSQPVLTLHDFMDLQVHRCPPSFGIQPQVQCSLKFFFIMDCQVSLSFSRDCFGT
jgi:hypothetical protein